MHKEKEKGSQIASRLNFLKIIFAGSNLKNRRNAQCIPLRTFNNKNNNNLCLQVFGSTLTLLARADSSDVPLFVKKCIQVRELPATA